MHACDERTAREVFDRLDRNKDSMVNVREFIITDAYPHAIGIRVLAHCAAQRTSQSQRQSARQLFA